MTVAAGTERLTFIPARLTTCTPAGHGPQGSTRLDRITCPQWTRSRAAAVVLIGTPLPFRKRHVSARNVTIPRQTPRTAVTARTRKPQHRTLQISLTTTEWACTDHAVAAIMGAWRLSWREFPLMERRTPRRWSSWPEMV